MEPVDVKQRHHGHMRSAIGVVVLHLGAGYAFFSALQVRFPAALTASLKVFEIARPPPESLRRDPALSDRPEGASAPPSLKARPVRAVAPKPDVPLVVPPPIVTAPVPGPGQEVSAGAAPVAGPGTGAGGDGTGLGGGGSGEGEGAGDFTPPRWIRGHIRDSDFPRDAGRDGIGRAIVLSFTVEPNGRATGCRVLESSGDARLDEATCRAIERRYRYAPSRDGEGKPVSAEIVEEHVWRQGED